MKFGVEGRPSSRFKSSSPSSSPSSRLFLFSIWPIITLQLLLLLVPDSAQGASDLCVNRCNRNRGGWDFEFIINCTARYQTAAERALCKADCEKCSWCDKKTNVFKCPENVYYPEHDDCDDPPPDNKKTFADCCLVGGIGYGLLLISFGLWAFYVLRKNRRGAAVAPTAGRKSIFQYFA